MYVSALIEKLNNGCFDNSLLSLYSGKSVGARRERILTLANDFLNYYGDMDVMLFSSPGRTEFSGNHTDHNNGFSLAASIDLDIIALASPINGNTVRIKSRGFREDIADITSPSPSDFTRKRSSASIVSGVSDYLKKNGFNCKGFVAYTSSEIAIGSGLSSSAAFEVLCARIFSALYNDGKIPTIELAKAAKYAENIYVGKPCGLLDQLACATGGCIWVDFLDPNSPKIEKIDFSVKNHGYTLCTVNTGGSHSGLTKEYTEITSEMRSVAALMGKKTLRECDESDFMNRIPYLRSIVGDRTVMRAMHYFAENRRVNLQKEALQSGDINGFLKYVSESGDSSFKYLQNVYSRNDVQAQGISLAIALSERMGVVCRVHGGGFAGTVQAYVKDEFLDQYISSIESVFGEKSCHICKIRPYGVALIEEDGIKN